MSEGEKTEEMSDARKRAFDTDLPVDERMEALAEDPPKEPTDWPSDRDMRNATFGGADGGEEGYDDGMTGALGPSEVRHHEDGSVSVHGEKVDNPEDYKGDKIEGDALDVVEHRQDNSTTDEKGSDADEDSSRDAVGDDDVDE